LLNSYEPKPAREFYKRFCLFPYYIFKSVGEVTRNTSPHREVLTPSDESNNSYEEWRRLHYDVQAGDEDSSSVQTTEVLTFVDNAAGDIENVHYEPSPIISAGSTLNTDLQSFLSRPTRIDTRTITTANSPGVLGTPIEPWYLLMNNTVIKNKLQNYAYIRAKLCLKFIINGTPFHCGKVLASYEPSVNIADTGFRKSRIIYPNTDTDAYVVPMSQLPHTAITIADNSGGELCLPFFLHQDWLPIGTAAMVKKMGRLTYYIVTPLKLASATGTTSVTIETFAWFENIELNGSTAALVLQAGDEYTGVVSKPASALMAVSKSLHNVPIIGKFARATTIGASAVASIASMFGFTNVPVIDSVHAVVPVGCPHLASSEISTPVQKLTLDPKQELSIDPTMHGLDSEDQMAICNIIKKPTIITTGTWDYSDATDDYLVSLRVNPSIARPTDVIGAAGTKATRVYHTWVSYLAAAFTHWRGDIILDFEVVCTKFHKGRLKIQWDPEQYTGAGLADSNKVYTTIIDIGECNKASLRIPYHQSTAWCRTGNPKQVMWAFGGAVNNGVIDEDNGQLTITVMTPLMSPVSADSVYYIMSIRGAENLEFANPRQSLTYISNEPPPSFFQVQAKDEIETETQEITFGDVGSYHPHRYDQNMGQAVVSLRTLLHRYSIYDVSCDQTSTATRAYIFTKSYTRNPPSFGYDPSGLSTANNISSGSGTSPFNYTPMHPISYFANLYGAFTGGVNYVANTSVDLSSSIGDVRVSRNNITTLATARAGANTAGLNSNNGVNYSRYWYNFFSPQYGLAGSAYTNTMTNGSLNWYAPHMLETNWCYTDPTYAIAGNADDETTNECTYLQAFMKQNVSGATSNLFSLTSYAGTGVDYNLLWLICCPTIDYYVSMPPTPAG